MKKLILYSLATAVLAGVVTLITDLLQNLGFISNSTGLTFVAFACWATYFLYGGTIQAAVQGWTSMIAGIICAIIIYVLTGVFAELGWDVAYIALPVAVIVGVFLMCMGEKVPYVNNVAAIFVGAALYFAIMGTSAAETGYVMVAVGELVYGALGLAAGYITVVFSTKIRIV